MPTKKLTIREIDIIEWVKVGKSSWEIAKILDITERTVNFHIENVMKKLDARNRTHAVAKFMELSLEENTPS